MICLTSFEKQPIDETESVRATEKAGNNLSKEEVNISLVALSIVRPAQMNVSDVQNNQDFKEIYPQVLPFLSEITIPEKYPSLSPATKNLGLCLVSNFEVIEKPTCLQMHRA